MYERRLYWGLAALLAVGLVAWLAVLADGKGGSASNSNGAEIVSVDELRKIAAERPTPIYWAGRQAGTELELSQLGGGRTYVRYLTEDADAGDPRADFLTIGTYIQSDPVTTLRRQDRESGGVLAEAPGDATVYFDPTKAHSVYLAYPGIDAQIEVYDPDFERALQIVDSGQIVSAG